MNRLILPVMGWIASLLFFWKDEFGIKKTTKVDMPLKTAKQNQLGGIILKVRHNDYLNKILIVLERLVWSSVKLWK